MRLTLADSLLSSSARRLNIRKRPDLRAQRQRYQGKTYWVVKDPVGLHYFRFQEEEYAILQMLDGQTSLDELKERFEAQFPPQKITLDELQNFLGMLHRSGLVLVDVQGQGAQLLKRRTERRRRELINAVSNVLCIRFKGVDPERFFAWLYPKVKWFFSPLAVGLCMAVILAALLLVAVEFDVFLSKLPTFRDFFTPANAFWLAVTLAVTKILHEFGHGLMCKHFRGECHELGIMILVLTPCLYCNVSDSWMLPNKWHRAAIGLAGIYVEVVLASIATFVWWFTEPGLLNNLCLNTMFIASVSTILFNGNPLLRYDGYYVLADLLEIPNLRQKATQILSRKAGEWFLGLEPSEDPFLPKRKQLWFALYSVAAALYRWLIIFSILWFLYRVFKPYRLEIIGRTIVAIALYGLFIRPIYQLGRFFYVPGRVEKVKKPRMYASLAGIALVGLAVLFLPLPYHVVATLEIQARDADPVYVDVPGRLAELLVNAGDRVTAGQTLARLHSRDLEKQIVELCAERDRLEAQWKNLIRRQLQDNQAGTLVPQIEEALQSVRLQLEQKQDEQARLTLVAKVPGTVLPPPGLHPPEDPDGPLPGWSGTPLLDRNVGAYLEGGTLFCQVGDPGRMEAVLVIDEADRPFVAEGQHVEIKLDAYPFETLEGQISKISPEQLRISPRRLSPKAGGELPTRLDPKTGVERPLSTSYQASVPLDDPDGILRLGLRGRAKVHMDRSRWQTIGQRFWRFLSRTFRFRM
ncbi:MAG: HlyD family efflux transporter periplasmic adaptor subunit [Thermoguttaceae bacterium]